MTIDDRSATAVAIHDDRWATAMVIDDDRWTMAMAIDDDRWTATDDVHSTTDLTLVDDC